VERGSTIESKRERESEEGEEIVRRGNNRAKNSMSDVIFLVVAFPSTLTTKNAYANPRNEDVQYRGNFGKLHICK